MVNLSPLMALAINSGKPILQFWGHLNLIMDADARSAASASSGAWKINSDGR